MRSKKSGAVMNTWTPDEALEMTGFSGMQWLVFTVAGLAWAADACAVMLLSFVGPAARCEWKLDPWQESMLASALFAGQLVGASPWGAFGDLFGRRVAMLWSCVLTGAFGVASAMAPSYSWLLVARAGAGFALSALPICFTLLLEWTPPRLRGRVMMLFNVWWTGGTILEACVAWAILNSLGWRVLVFLTAVPQLLVVASYPWLPESPQWLIAQASAARTGAASEDGLMICSQATSGAAEAKASKYEAAARAVLQRSADMAGVVLPAGQLVAHAVADSDDHDKAAASDEEHGSQGGAWSSSSAASAGTSNASSRASITMARSDDAGTHFTSTSVDGPSPAAKQRRVLASRTAIPDDQEPLMGYTATAGGRGRRGRHSHKRSKPAHPLLQPAMFTLMFVWFVAACGYYGVVILAAQLNMVNQEPMAVDTQARLNLQVDLQGWSPDATSGLPDNAVAAPALSATDRALGKLQQGHVQSLEDGVSWDTSAAASRDLLYYHEEEEGADSDPTTPSQSHGSLNDRHANSEFLEDNLREDRFRVADVKAPSIDTASAPAHDDCVDGAIHLPSSTFTAVIMASMSEIPAMMLSTMVVGAGVNHGHRCSAVALTMSGTAVALLLDVAVRAHSDVQVSSWAAWMDTIVLMASRCLVCASFNLLYIYTPELLAPKVRALGVGICNTLSRLGGLVAPILAVGLVERGEEKLSIGIMGALCSGAALVLWIVPPHESLVQTDHIF